MAIKTSPEDFVVEEDLTPQFLAGMASDRGPFALYQVRKRLLTTHELLDALARRLKVPLSDLAAAGLKDKQAVTTQHLTLKMDMGGRAPSQRIDADSFQAQLIGFVREPIDSQAILRNRFRIIVRLKRKEVVEEIRHAALRYALNDADGAGLLIPNYFGNQRFGSARAGQGFIAAHLVRGEFEQALRLAVATPHRKDERNVKSFKQMLADSWTKRRWGELAHELPRVPERAAIEHLARKADDYRGAFAALPYFFQQLCVEAYQSLLWNRIASAVLIEQLGASGRLWVVDDKFGQLVFPEAGAVGDALRDLDIPLPGRKTTLREPWRAVAESVLKTEGLAGVEALRIPGMDKPWFGESPRTLFMHAYELTIGKPKRDDNDARGVKVEIGFALPRGGYATVVLRALGQ